MALLVTLPPVAFAQDVPEHATNTILITPAPVTTPSEVSEVRSASVRLRDSLRQPLAEGQAAGKPYRLSAEERQRLRELLRGQPDPATQTR